MADKTKAKPDTTTPFKYTLVKRQEPLSISFDEKSEKSSIHPSDEKAGRYNIAKDMPILFVDPPAPLSKATTSKDKTQEPQTEVELKFSAGSMNHNIFNQTARSLKVEVQVGSEATHYTVKPKENLYEVIAETQKAAEKTAAMQKEAAAKKEVPAKEEKPAGRAPEAKEVTPAEAREKAVGAMQQLIQKDAGNKFFQKGNKGQNLDNYVSNLKEAAGKLKGEGGKEPDLKLVKDFYEKLDALRTSLTNIRDGKPDRLEHEPGKKIHPKGVEAINGILGTLKEVESTAKDVPGIKRPDNKRTAIDIEGVKAAMSGIMPSIKAAAAMLSNQQTHDQNSIQLAQTGQAKPVARDNGGRGGSTVV